MTRILLFVSWASLVGGCAIVSGAPGAPTAAATTSKYDVMQSQPPAPQAEDTPKLAQGEVWVPGYYQPVSGTWMWHPGQVATAKQGYRLVPASYHEESGKVHFTPPRWRRADLVDLAPKAAEVASQK